MPPAKPLLTPKQQDQLRQAYAEDSAAQAILDHLAMQKQSAEQTTVDSMERIEGLAGEITREQITRFFRRLHKTGLGEYQVGRRGTASRFVWSVPSKRVGQFARGSQASDAPNPAGPELGPQSAPPQGPRFVGGRLRHQYILRADLQVELLLPADLSPLEARRLARFIETLPMTQPEE